MTRIYFFIFIFIYTNIRRTTICEIMLTKDRNYEVIYFQIPKTIWTQALNPTPVLRQQATVVLPIHVADDDINDIEDEEEDTEVSEASVAQYAPVIEPVGQDEVVNVNPAVISNVTEAAIPEEDTTENKVKGSVFKFPCSCVHGQCGCCTGSIMETFWMKTCGNISFVPEDFVFDVKMNINDFTVLRRRVSADNPPPICFNPKRVPFVRICAELSNIRIRNRNAFACLDMTADIGGFQVYSASFKCFGLGMKGVQAGLKPKPISSGPAPVSLFGNTDNNDDRDGFLSHVAGGMFGGGGGIFGGGSDDDEGPLDAIEDAVVDILDRRRLN